MPKSQVTDHFRSRPLGRCRFPAVTLEVPGETLPLVAKQFTGTSDDAHATVSRQRRELPRATLAAAGEVKASLTAATRSARHRGAPILISWMSAPLIAHSCDRRRGHVG